MRDQVAGSLVRFDHELPSTVAIAATKGGSRLHRLSLLRSRAPRAPGGRAADVVIAALARDLLERVTYLKKQELASAETSRGGSMTVPREDLANWFPADVQSEYASKLGSNVTDIEVDAVQIPGSVFAAPEKSPAIHGRALVFEKHNLVYLNLFTM